VAARTIKHIMTGNLDAPVLSMPWFPGKERHFLRAQIARISATCSLAAKGWYEPDEEAGPGKIKEAEAPTESFPGQEDLASEAGWVHRMPCLNKIGRCTFPDVEALTTAELINEEQIKAINLQIEAEGDPRDLLGGIDSDLSEIAKPEGEEDNVKAWSFKVFGDKGLYKFAEADRTHQVTAVRSMIWPGATTVAQGTKFANIYIGYAMKCGTLMPPNPQTGLSLLPNTDPFSPLVPDDIMDEPQDLEEQDEPNPGEDDVASLGESVDPAEEEG
jgi:hypothetical protein